MTIPSPFRGTTGGTSFEEQTIDYPLLNRRIQDEIMALVILAAEVQIALGPTLAEARSLSPAVQRSLQAIDRLQQTLDDLQRVMGFMAAQSPHAGIKIEPLSHVIKLRHLAHKLFDDVDTPFALAEDDSGDIAWF
ncbi:hypothetical protein AQS8620_02976 [Aquimixticola soesokkakensis]|uniref:Uncharacterized protein n=1 Tax=Aquimixticola soesokkakensis TaxID=1519096 RepID=A0A1Y5TIE1_9RHOB|nr:hypothetical protein [Aquimixticola soesokkakensis]SLN64838.1 hypothetical protein AQS8620_02976 [Aquimixticola soesokkakensis]